jgi:hypothetical protein
LINWSLHVKKSKLWRNEQIKTQSTSQLKKIPIQLKKIHFWIFKYKLWKFQVYLLIEIQLWTMHEEDIITKTNWENTTSRKRESHATKTTYRHPNHKRTKYKQLTYCSMYIDASTIEFHDNNSSQESYKHNGPQRIKLGCNIILQFDNYAQHLEVSIVSYHQP